MDEFKDILKTVPLSLALAFIFYRIMAAAFTAHKDAMKEQRDDLLSHMKTTCQGRIPPGTGLVLLLALLLSTPGCTTGQGGTVGDFNVTTPIGSIGFKTWTVDSVSRVATTQPVH